MVMVRRLTQRTQLTWCKVVLVVLVFAGYDVEQVVRVCWISCESLYSLDDLLQHLLRVTSCAEIASSVVM